MEAQQLIDSIEQDIQRMRIDEALKASLVSRLDELRAAASPRVLIAPSGDKASAEKMARALRSVMCEHIGTRRNLA
jgi:hypothetical protein